MILIFCFNDSIISLEYNKTTSFFLNDLITFQMINIWVSKGNESNVVGTKLIILFTIYNFDILLQKITIVM